MLTLVQIAFHHKYKSERIFYRPKKTGNRGIDIQITVMLQAVLLLFGNISLVSETIRKQLEKY
jgi:hypothetical protein